MCHFLTNVYKVSYMSRDYAKFMCKFRGIFKNCLQNYKNSDKFGFFLLNYVNNLRIFSALWERALPREPMRPHMICPSEKFIWKIRTKILKINNILLCPRYFQQRRRGRNATKASFYNVYWRRLERRRRPEMKSGYARIELMKYRRRRDKWLRMPRLVIWELQVNIGKCIV